MVHPGYCILNRVIKRLLTVYAPVTDTSRTLLLTNALTLEMFLLCANSYIIVCYKPFNVHMLLVNANTFLQLSYVLLCYQTFGTFFMN